MTDIKPDSDGRSSVAFANGINTNLETIQLRIPAHIAYKSQATVRNEYFSSLEFARFKFARAPSSGTKCYFNIFMELTGGADGGNTHEFDFVIRNNNGTHIGTLIANKISLSFPNGYNEKYTFGPYSWVHASDFINDYSFVLTRRGPNDDMKFLQMRYHIYYM